VAFAVGLILVCVVGVVDYLSAPHLSLAAFYLLPILLVAWYVDLLPALLICAAGAAANLVDESMHGLEGPAAAPYWNSAVRLGAYLITTSVVLALRQSNLKLQKAEAFRDDLTHMLVHDLKNPLVSAEMAVGGMERGLEACDGLGESEQSMLRVIRESHHRIERMIEDVLDVGRAEAGKLPLQLGPTDVTEVIRRTTSEAVPRAERMEISLETSLPAEALIAQADEDKVHRVLENLIANALRFAPPGEGWVRVSAAVHDREVWVVVADNGIGIPAALQERIFDKFGQAEAAQAGVRLSFGLGLTFCRLAVESMGGRLWVESAPGQGSTFTFALPLANSASSPGVG
jgi:signal transduction histidine kinase